MKRWLFNAIDANGETVYTVIVYAFSRTDAIKTAEKSMNSAQYKKYFGAFLECLD